MSEFRVVWRIDIDADTPYEAARQALAMQRNPASIATVFHVTSRGGGREIEIDLDEESAA